MKTIRSWDDLRPYGVVLLTGESCGLSYRLLCDVTDRGRAIIEKCLGVRITFAESWNRGTDDEPHTGSILLAPEMLVPLGVFALLETGCTEVWLIERWLLGIEYDDKADAIAAAHEMHGEKLVRRFRYGGTAGDRNIHTMSGRIT